MGKTRRWGRWLGGLAVALGLDWLDGYVGFSPALKTQTANMLVRWSDYVRDNGYHSNFPQSNYGAGHYVSRTLIANSRSKTASGSACPCTCP